jgi:L-asparaginase
MNIARYPRRMAGATALLILWLVNVPPVMAAEASRPTVLIIATGGTISGVQDDPEDPTRYRAGALSAETIVESVPGLSEHARIEVLQFSNMPSTQIKPADWVRLSQTVSRQLTGREDLAGVVITHGTDRMEETAFFLHLTVASEKPVVMVGAQRPATHFSADGPANLLAAVRTAVAPQSRDRGVLLVMDERILSAREVRKDFPRVGGFSAGRIGILGSDGPLYLYRPSRPHTHRAEFELPQGLELPEVDLVFSYSGGSGPGYDNAPAGIVVAATGATCEETLALRHLSRQGVAVAVAFPTGEAAGALRPVEETAPQRERDACASLAGDPRWEGEWIPPLPAPMLTPQKARILLMLALTRSRERAVLADIFMRY